MEGLSDLANHLIRHAKRTGITIIVAESCTAGLMSQILSDAEGAADYFHGGFVTYTKEHKTSALGVPASLLRDKGAVCGEVARAMAEGALTNSAAGISAAITGVAGPEPDEDGNPVGRVCVAIARRGFPIRDFEVRYGDIGRDTIRKRAVADALLLDSVYLIRPGKIVKVGVDIRPLGQRAANYVRGDARIRNAVSPVTQGNPAIRHVRNLANCWQPRCGFTKCPGPREFNCRINLRGE